MTAMEKMIKARAALILQQRFYGKLALELRLVEDEKAETMWTDGKSLGFNPEFVLNQSMDETKAVICHEVMHCALGHHCRRNGRNADSWNEATDYAINPIILNSGMKLPKEMLFDPNFNEKSADEIYSIIEGRKKKSQNGQNQQQNNQQQGQQGNNQQNQPPNSPDNGQPQQSQGGSQGQQGKTPPKQNSSGSSGSADPGKCGEVRDYPGDNGQPTESESKKQEQDWKVKVAAAANQAKGCGHLPGSLAELVSEFLEPKVSWKEALQRFVEQVSRNDYTYQRTNPRYASFDIIMPSLYNKELPPIDVWIDTSGSVSSKDLQQFVSEVNDIRSHYQTTIRIIMCDTAVVDVIIVEKEDVLTQLALKGRGGTDFVPAIKWSMEQDEQPACGIYLTDMDCSSFGKEPDFPVLWVQTEGKRKNPPFGELIMMQESRF